MTIPIDEEELEREGRTAAAAGQDWRTNPFLRRDRMPMTTRESVGEWARKRDAWQRGYEGEIGSQEDAQVDGTGLLR